MNKRRLTLGLQFVNLYGSYFAQLWPGIRAAADEMDANVLLLPGRTANYPSSYGYEYQASTVLSLLMIFTAMRTATPRSGPVPK
jgi:hypothetical protein